MRITESALKHGVSDADMLHAARMPFRTIAHQDGGRTLVIGVDQAGRFLEIVVKDAGDDTEPEIIHADVLRPGYYRFLKGVMTMTKDEQTTDEWLAGLERDETVEAKDASDLRGIGEALIGIEYADAALVAAVERARANGRSWTEIANVLGVTRQAARQRFTGTGGGTSKPETVAAKVLKSVSGIEGKPTKKVAAKAIRRHVGAKPAAAKLVRKNATRKASR